MENKEIFDKILKASKYRKTLTERNFKEPELQFQKETSKYKLDVYSLSFIEGNYWAYSLGVICKKDTGEYIEGVLRNYASFPYLFIEDYKKHDYLLCGEDYQGQSIIQLDTKKRIDYLPKDAKKGFGFCWIDIHRNNNELLIEGCYWACPYEFVTYDFSNPMKLPYKKLLETEIPFYNYKNLKYLGKGLISVKQKREVRKSDNKPLDDIESKEEHSRLLKNPSEIVWETREIEYNMKNEKIKTISSVITEEAK